MLIPKLPVVEQVRQGVLHQAVPAAQPEGHPPQPGLVDRHNLRTDGQKTYVPSGLIDIFSRRILSWMLGNTLDASESVEVLRQAIARFRTPGIINSEQGSQYTSELWAEACGNTMKVSMDGRGRAKDNEIPARKHENNKLLIRTQEAA